MSPKFPCLPSEEPAVKVDPATGATHVVQAQPLAPHELGHAADLRSWVADPGGRPGLVVRICSVCGTVCDQRPA